MDGADGFHRILGFYRILSDSAGWMEWMEWIWIWIELPPGVRLLLVRLLLVLAWSQHYSAE